MYRAKKIIVWIALLSVMIAIYVFSSQNADESDSLSEGLLSKILERVIDSFSEMEDGAKAELINQYNRLIRKCAHFSIYTLKFDITLSHSASVNILKTSLLEYSVSF